MRRTGAALLIAIVVSLVAGCESTRPLPESWNRSIQLESQHFSLKTDAPPELAPRVLETAELVHAECREVFGDQGTGRIKLVVFANQYNFGRYHGLDLPNRETWERRRRQREAGTTMRGVIYDTPAGHYRRTAFGGDEIALHYQDRFEGALRHELAHVFLRRRYKNPPAWLDEGVAEYVRLHRDPSERAKTLRALRAGLATRSLPSLHELVEWRHSRLYREGAAAYDLSWLLVRHLIEHEGVLDLRAPAKMQERARALAARTGPAGLLERVTAAR